MNRRDFLRGVSAAVVIQACGKIVTAATRQHLSRETVFRFVVASDWHYGQPGTDATQFYHDLQKAFAAYQAQYPCEFFVLNGDVIHNDPALLLPAATLLKQLHPRLYVTRGNHDMVTPAAWEQAWGFPLCHDVVIKDQVILLGDTANEKGQYLCPDVSWFTAKLEQYKSASNIFIFLHITPVKWTKSGVDCPEFQDLIRKYPNVRAVFNGHDHDQDGVKLLDDKIPFLFDGHMGGSWGTDYRGFRVVELKTDGSMVSYLMNPYHKQAERTFAKV
ncbi:metallophosphoesterase family protein [Chitinophaga nivalis]|uniref:Metallophosphoesterase n=1 Tax=Chitinophaga nivalis TaxID=2991709 RepID=A0ABT3IT65_9BACT|nr:metallophosphoesterase [Chitinophaga nivalis]MCW3463137.1 metallophosphoesterase [Chitinophaga nivalis]MCW3487173.1 metallophosphoesterase [Chitinophaga nivalis]